MAGIQIVAFGGGVSGGVIVVVVVAVVLVVVVVVAAVSACGVNRWKAALVLPTDAIIDNTQELLHVQHMRVRPWSHVVPR